MKIRDGFVSNSSSSSFVISRNDLSATQLYQLIHHEELASSFGLHCDPMDAWYVDDDLANIVKGSTHMDNFSMVEFFNYIGIDIDKVKWDC